MGSFIRGFLQLLVGGLVLRFGGSCLGELWVGRGETCEKLIGRDGQMWRYAGSAEGVMSEH